MLKLTAVEKAHSDAIAYAVSLEAPARGIRLDPEYDHTPDEDREHARTVRHDAHRLACLAQWMREHSVTECPPSSVPAMYLVRK